MLIDLHALANQPGYGKAEAALRKAGMWKLDPMEKLEQSLNDASGAMIIAQDFLEQAEYDYRKAMEATT